MDPLLERQVPIDREIANALIAATPEWWQTAEMRIEREDDHKNEKLNIVIISPDGLNEPISPTDDIYASVYKLSDLFREHQKMWTSATYAVAQEEAGWKYKVTFEY